MGNSIDWKAYNRNLITRGQITFWFSEDALNQWIAAPTLKRGGQKFYSDNAIDVLSVIRFRYQLTLRSAQGFAESLFDLMGVTLPVPCYTTLCRRLSKLSVKLQAKYFHSQSENVESSAT